MSLFNELKRRNVFKVAIAYVVVAWLVLQVADVILNNVSAPGWVFSVIMLLLGIGLPFAIIFAWAFEMTPEGLKREHEVDRSQSITHQTGRKLDFTIIGVLAVALVYFIYESRFAGDGNVTPAATTAADSTPTATESTGDTASADNENTIAVLPFVNRSNQEDDAFFADGMHDDLLTQLAKISDLKVISRTSMMKYKDTEMTVPEIAAELGVGRILEGGVQRAGKRVRINAQLIDVNTDEHLWAETYDREMTVENLFDIQSEITRHIVEAVRGELTEEESAALASIPTENMEAYEAYMRAREILNRPDYMIENYIDAQPWVARALELDPEFALAWAAQVQIHGQMIWLSEDVSEARYQAIRDALDMANRYGLGLPEVLEAQAEYYYRIENDYHASERALRTAIEGRPGDADLRETLAYSLRRTGKHEESIANFQKAIELDPSNVRARNSMIETLLNMKQPERAEPLLKRWIEMYPEARDLRAHRIDLQGAYFGKREEARALFEAMEPYPSNAYVTGSVNLAFLENDPEVMRTVIESPRMESLWETPLFGAWAEITLAELLNANGEKDEAQAMATQALESLDAQDYPRSDHPRAQLEGTRSQALLLLDDLEGARKAIDLSVQLIPESRDSLAGYDFTWQRAKILGRSGERELALAEIERLLNEPSGTTRWDLYYDPTWNFFRDDERFNDLIRPEGAPEVER